MRLRKLLRSGALALVVLALSGCRQAPSVPPTQAKTETIPSITPAPALPATATPTEAPRIPTPTRAQPSPAPTPNSLEAAAEVLTGMSIDVQRLYSPDRGRCEWYRLLAYSWEEQANIKYGGQFFTYVTVRCYRDVETKWELVRQWSEQALGYRVPYLLGWSADGSRADGSRADANKLYFYDAIIPDGPQPLGGFQENLREVDLKTGAVHQIPFQMTGGISLSPDARRVAYYDMQTLEVGVYDLVREQEQRIPFEVLKDEEIWYAGEVTWSPDGQQFLFLIQYGLPFPTGSSIRLVDVAQNTLRTVVEKDERVLGIVEWTDPDQALLAGPAGMQWKLDLKTGELEAVSSDG